MRDFEVQHKTRPEGFQDISVRRYRVLLPAPSRWIRPLSSSCFSTDPLSSHLSRNTDFFLPWKTASFTVSNTILVIIASICFDCITYEQLMTMLFDHVDKTGLAPAPVDERKAFDYYEAWKLS